MTMNSQKKDINNGSDTSKRDKELLDKKQNNLRTDGGDDQQLIDRVEPVDFEGKDLDIPGRTLPEDRTQKQFKDEENQLYSQGGSDNDALEENGNDH